jgi:hypothetical protein
MTATSGSGTGVVTNWRLAITSTFGADLHAVGYRGP